MRENPGLDLLGDYPFQRLAALLEDVPPAEGVTPVMMHVGEPKLPQPGLVADEIARNAHLWSRYPPGEGSVE